MSRLGNFEFEDLKNFQKKLDKLTEKAPAFLEACIKELAGQLLDKAVAKTPVSSGLLRRSWKLGPVVSTSTGVQIEIMNPTEYASDVEYGYWAENHTRRVEGRFMLKISIQELEHEMPSILERRLEEFMRKHLRW
ncbi:HK97 gp10 family phage protein [Paenibacillus alba]|uniref:HK97 gp10 family phage protein n=1 Tax=Paenibacillus alba TaxID=1197127 RepID=A0ABU6GDN1_9BACL|nr:HK97 gp10 family phage protein [Paenibacillus alba]MEC0232277.1 HK97 gp10 family phage protein [Paenibacillus alba]NQX68061.1 HK97 gp10 family phage protein [Paenibacillus alba]